MLRTSLIFLAMALLALVFADIEITTQAPWHEMGRMLVGALTPRLDSTATIFRALLNTVTFALCGTALAVAAGAVASFWFHRTPVRLGCAFIRAIHEIFWAFIFLPVVGLNAICGVLAIAIPYTGIFAKVFAEIRQESDQRPMQALPVKASSLSRFLYGSLPIIYNDIRHYTSYRFECALRSSAVLGFIGLPTLGFHLETAFREGLYGQAAAILYLFYLLIALKRYWAHPRLIGVLVVAALMLLSKEVSFSWENMARFFTYDILPWPMRREGVLDGSREVVMAWGDTARWAWEVFTTHGVEGIINTVILTQIALAVTGIMTVAALPFAVRHLVSRFTARFSGLVLIILRTTPEYMLAYLFLQMLGPSMLPAILAISLHNGAILTHLSANNAHGVTLRPDAPQKRTDRYFYELLPRSYGQLLAFLFYRWEVMMRESAILGILGIYTLGFFIDSAMADQHLDTALLLIVITAALNMGIDSLSQRIRRRLKISTKLTTTDAISAV